MGTLLRGTPPVYPDEAPSSTQILTEMDLAGISSTAMLLPLSQEMGATLMILNISSVFSYLTR